jgi:hypothetical protein
MVRCIQVGCDHPVPGATGPLAACGCCMWFAWCGPKDKTWKRYLRDFPAECQAELAVA